MSVVAIEGLLFSSCKGDVTTVGQCRRRDAGLRSGLVGGRNSADRDQLGAECEAKRQPRVGIMVGSSAAIGMFRVQSELNLNTGSHTVVTLGAGTAQ